MSQSTSTHWSAPTLSYEDLLKEFKPLMASRVQLLLVASPQCCELFKALNATVLPTGDIAWKSESLSASCPVYYHEWLPKQVMIVWMRGSHATQLLCFRLDEEGILRQYEILPVHPLYETYCKLIKDATGESL